MPSDPDVDPIDPTEPARRLPSWVAVSAYAAAMLVAAGFCALVCRLGTHIKAPMPPEGWVEEMLVLEAGPADAVPFVFATLAAVIALGYVFGRICVAVGQPPVVGEILAGIALGPSLLGLISPSLMYTLVPGADVDPYGDVMAALRSISQLGVALYMFLVGLELNGGKLRNHVGAAVIISHSSIAVSFFLGTLTALALYPLVSHRGIPFVSFCLFMGSALSVTAFPVMARILADRKLDKTDLGLFSLGCAAIDDVTAWCLLAFVVGVAQAEATGGLKADGLLGPAMVGFRTLMFFGVMFLVVRPAVEWATRRLDAIPGPLPHAALPGLMVGVLACALATESIGVHAVIGAFVFGVVVPHDSRIAREITTLLHGVVTVLLLPAFFALIGMRTDVTLIDTWWKWALCLMVVGIATLGKFGGTYLAARATGHDRQSATALGALMNTRGLIGLIVLNIGLNMNVITPTLFSMMVIMAVVTTMATAPVLDRLITAMPGAEPRDNTLP